MNDEVVIAWEYLTFKFQAEGFLDGGVINNQAFEKTLNHHGQEGWELVSVVAAHAGKGWTRDVVAVMKRRLRTKPKAVNPNPPKPGKI